MVQEVAHPELFFITGTSLGKQASEGDKQNSDEDSEEAKR